MPLNMIARISGLRNSIAKAEELIFSCPHKHRAVKKRLGKYHGACSAWRKYVAENT